MKEYRITTMVTVDVRAKDESIAINKAMEEIDELVRTREDQAGVRNTRCTGIARDNNGEFMVYEQRKVRA